MTEQNRQESGFCAKNLRNKARDCLATNPWLIDFPMPEGPGDILIDRQPAAAGTSPAAVLVPIIDRGNDGCVLLTKRSDDLPHHAGQISFPGGKIDRKDKDVEATALRETCEETGIGPESVDLLGQLDPHVTATGFTIYPVIGLLVPPLALQPCAREVAEIFEVPWSFLMEENNYGREEIVWEGRPYPHYVIEYKNYRIWGATAAILKMMQERLFGI